MADEAHRMMCVRIEGVESRFVCTVEGCGRVIIIDRLQPRVTVVTPGDTTVRHYGSNGPMMITGAIAQMDPA